MNEFDQRKQQVQKQFNAENIHLHSANFTVHSLYPPRILQYTKRNIIESDLKQLLMLCSSSRRGVISLEGMGGSGKTTLAAYIVGQEYTSALFPSGVFWLTIGRDRIGERLSSYICEVVQALTGAHFAANDLAVASAALIDALSNLAEPVLLVLDDVWTDEQVSYLLRGGPAVSRLVISRNRLGVLQIAHRLELSMMSREEAIETLFLNIPSGVKQSLDKDLLDALVSFSHYWPVLLSILNAALKENIRSGASLDEVADWLIELLQRSGPGALDETLFVSIEKSVEATLGATLDLIVDDAKDLFYSMCVFDSDVVVPDHIIFAYWMRRFNIEQSEGRHILAMLTFLRLIYVHWLNGRPGRVLHDVVRDFIIHQLAKGLRANMSSDLVESWRSTHLPLNAQNDWWHLPLSETFIFEHLSTQMIRAGLAKERDILLQDFRWYIAQIMSLGSVVTAIADLEETDSALLLAIERFFSQNAMLFRRESAIGGLASTLLVHASNNSELFSLVQELDGVLDWPLVRSILPLVSLAPNLVRGHLGPIGDVAISPDGSVIATVSDDSMALLLDAKTGAIIKRLIGHRERARSCSFSSSGKYLLTSGMDGTARVWDVVTGDSVIVMRRDGFALLGSCWSPSGTLIAGAYSDGVTVVWRAQDGEVIASLQTGSEEKGTWDCKFIDEDQLITAGEDGHLRCWIITEGKCTLDLSIHKGRIRRCDISSDGNFVLTASSDHTAGLIALGSGQILGYLHGHTDRLRSARFSLDGRQIITAAEDSTIRIWDTASLSQLDKLQAHHDWIGMAIFEGKESSIVSCGADVQVLRLAKENKDDSVYQESKIITRGGDDTNACCFSLDGSSVYYGKVGWIRVLTMGQNTKSEFGEHTGRILSIAIDNEILFSSGADGTIKSYDLRDKELLEEFFVGARIWAIDIIPNLRQLVSVAEDGVLRVHSTENLALLQQEKMLDGHLMACAAHPRQQKVCFAGDGPKLTIISLPTLSNRREIFLEGFRSLWACAYSNDGTRIAVGGEPGTQTLILQEDGKASTILETRVGRVTSVAFNCDDRLVATCGDDGYVAIWDSSNGSPLTGFRVHFPLRHCAWSPQDPELLAVGGTGGEYLLRIDGLYKRNG